MKKILNKGFTLVELMVVIVIIGVLAAVAIPKFTQASHKAKASEFPTVLSSIYQAEHTYQTENGTFTTFATLTSGGELNVPASGWFSYNAWIDAGGTSFTGQAAVGKSFGDALVNTTAYIGTLGAKSADAGLAKYAPNWK